jgi:hypothetical protein
MTSHLALRLPLSLPLDQPFLQGEFHQRGAGTQSQISMPLAR